MSASAFCHRERAKLVALALLGLGLACGPPKLMGDGDGDAGDESSSSSSSSSETTDTGTIDIETTDTETTDTETTHTLTFVPYNPDIGETFPCDLLEQNCPNGEKCVPYGSTGGFWDENKCVPVIGEQAPGEPCTYGGTVESTDDCDATSFCWDVQDVDGEALGTCAQFCTGTPDDPECPAGGQCLEWNCDCIYLCVATCDPILQDCGEGLACYWATNAFHCVVTMQGVPSGEPCGYINDCAGGNGCIDTDALPNCGGAACCSPWCELGAGDVPCEAVPGTTCVPFFEQGLAPLGYEHVGVCLLSP
jgi:hypothetical protein